MKYLIATTSVLAGLLAVSSAGASEVQDKARALATAEISQIASDPVVIEAIKAQNAKHASLTQDDVDSMDKTWRAERKSATSPMIDDVASRPVSSQLASFRDSGKGLYTEVFVMDDKGLNVGMSDPTSDYWQGDEAKWKETFLAGPDAIHVSDVEKDDSTGTFQLQVSTTVVDGGKPIGAITVGVDADQLMTR